MGRDQVYRRGHDLLVSGPRCSFYQSRLTLLPSTGPAFSHSLAFSTPRRPRASARPLSLSSLPSLLSFTTPLSSLANDSPR